VRTQGADAVECRRAQLDRRPGVARCAWTGPTRARAGEVIDSVSFVALDRTLLLAAGALAEPSLRVLDAIHVAAAASLAPIDGLLGYDERQAVAARLAGIRTFAPGASESVGPR
jgi:hypothetical protein